MSLACSWTGCETGTRHSLTPGGKIATAFRSAQLSHELEFATHTENGLLRRHLNQVRDGKGSVVLIGGTAGVGKTRIAIELAVEAARVGITTLVGRCYDREDPVPFVPFVEILEAALERASSRVGFRALLGTDAGEISRLMPQLSRLFTDIPGAMELGPAQSQWILFKAVGDLIGRMAAGNPLLLLLEDLHWADQGTLALLEHLARNVYKIPALIVSNYRDDEEIRNRVFRPRQQNRLPQAHRACAMAPRRNPCRKRPPR